MKGPYFGQMLNALDEGIIITDRDGTIVFFNHWLVLASNIPAEAAIGKHLLGVFPQLDTALFHRNFRSVLSFGNTAFFSHSANPWLIPLAPAPGSAPGFDKMQQSGQLGPLRENDTIQFVYLIIRDITETVTDVQHLTRMAMHDSLTGAWNRRWFDHWLREELSRAERYSRELGLIMSDLDHFKLVNDQYGHQAGDRILASAAKCCTSLIRATDTLARYGGEEFCIILPETDSDAARALAERIRTGIAALETAGDQSVIKITVSLGVSNFSPGISADELLNQADAALYQAKTGGRNQVVAGPLLA